MVLTVMGIIMKKTNEQTRQYAALAGAKSGIILKPWSIG